jgi:hypothetical protein
LLTLALLVNNRIIDEQMMTNDGWLKRSRLRLAVKQFWAKCLYGCPSIVIFKPFLCLQVASGNRMLRALSKKLGHF